MVFGVHSHPDKDDDKGGSGYVYDFDANNKLYLKEYDAWGRSDGIPAKYLFEKTGRVIPLYVYHRYSQGLYRFTPWNNRAEKWENDKKIRSGSHMRSIILKN